jgi:hypothetical protein
MRFILLFYCLLLRLCVRACDVASSILAADRDRYGRGDTFNFRDDLLRP